MKDDRDLAAYFDCVGGIAGNMALAAVVDAGVSPRWIRQTVARVTPDFRLKIREDTRSGLRGTSLKVVRTRKDQPRRRLPQIVKMIRKSGIPEPVQEKTIAVFTRLATAESRVHRIKPEDVHFHEVGAIDAIVDITGTVAGLHRLGVTQLSCSPLPLAGGTVQCAHGTIPLPAPAVLELVKGVPVIGVEGEEETVTPTGAAIVTALAQRFGPLPAMTVEKTGAGLGDREFGGRPNLLRLILGRVEGRAETAVQIEAAIDDMTPERYDYLMDRLHEAGALEVMFVPAQMKKNRPGVLARVLAPTGKRDGVREALFSHSTTLGTREYRVSRAVLPRRTETVETGFGRIRVKVATRPDGTEHRHPEYDDLKRAARKAGVSLETVEAAVTGAVRKKGGRR